MFDPSYLKLQNSHSEYVFIFLHVFDFAIHAIMQYKTFSTVQAYKTRVKRWALHAKFYVIIMHMHSRFAFPSCYIFLFNRCSLLLDEEEGTHASSLIPLDDGVPLDYCAIEVIQCLIEHHNTIFTDANETVWG